MDNLTFCIFVLTLCILNVECYSNTDVRALKTELFKANAYDTSVRPAADFNDPTVIHLDFFLIGLNNIDEVGQKMTTTAFLRISWTDEYLKWTKAAHNEIDKFFVFQSKIWRPDFSLVNGLTAIKEMGNSFLLAQVENDGQVFWSPYEVFESECTIDILHFPFDTQSCSIRLSTWTTQIDDVTLSLGSDKIILNGYEKNDEWTLVSSSSEIQSTIEDGTMAVFTLTLKRNPRYYILNIIAPVLFLSILVNFTFVIPVDSGEKMSYSMTVYLAFAVFLTIISASFPVSSSPSILSVYLVFLLSIGTLIVMITGAELRLHHRKDSYPIPAFFRSLVRRSKRTQCRNYNKYNGSVSISKDGSGNKNVVTPVIELQEKPRDNEEEMSWRDVSAAVDFFCFFLFLFINVSVTMTLFLYSFYASK